jgi:penicillin amidase
MTSTAGRWWTGALWAALATSVPTPALAEMSTAVRKTHRDVAGLEAPAEIIIDHWGIPHIYAKSERDAFFLQGYNAARDRLWQIDLWRKRGLGKLSESFGRKYLEQDRAARLFLYRGDMNAEWAAYGVKAKSYSEAFVAGINAYVREILDGKREMPVEFRISKSVPALWAPEDVVRIRSHGLTRNVASEVRRAQVTCAAGLEADALRRKLEPEWHPKVPDGLEPCAIPADVLNLYSLATSPVSFEPRKGGIAMVDPDMFLRQSEVNANVIGSNNWVVGPQRTETGRPILANDPHRAHGVPSLRYIVHMNAPQMSVIGAGEPALPGISIGHNGAIAFGLTIFNIDQEDLYVYELNPKNRNEYRYGGHWEAMKTVKETVEVQDGAAETFELKFTRHGPVLAVDEKNNRAFALRTVWLEPGTSAYFGSADYMTAKNWQQFLSAMDRFQAPSENQIYADIQGNIGWIPAGMTPRRDNWDGLLPVPGDGRYEWGFFARKDLPIEFNPKRGWFASANEMNLPPDYPVAQRRIGFEWADPSRMQRISEVLGRDDKISLADAMDLQVDDTSMLARRVISLARNLRAPAGTPRNVLDALELVRKWDAKLDVDSPEAALFEIWIGRHLGRATIAVASPEAARKMIGNGDPGAVLDLIENPDTRLGSNPAAMRDSILINSLAEAVREAEGLLGVDQKGWAWGKLHQAEFIHNLTPLAEQPLKDQMRVGPLAMGGSGSTPRAAGYDSDFKVTSGASFRMVLDVGNWDASRAINAPGQSGDPYSPHYRDLAPLWAAGEYVPLLYSRTLVEQNASKMLILSPATASRPKQEQGSQP